MINRKGYIEIIKGKLSYDLLHDAKILPDGIHTLSMEYPTVEEYARPKFGDYTMIVNNVCFFREKTYERYIIPYNENNWMGFETALYNGVEKINLQRGASEDSNMRYFLDENSILIVNVPNNLEYVYFECTIEPLSQANPRIFSSPSTCSNFESELSTIINRYSMENNSNTPDYILAKYLTDCLKAFEVAVKIRDKKISVPKNFSGTQI